MIEFNEDGSLKVPDNIKNKKKIPDYVYLLRSIDELPFSVGKKLLKDFVRGIDSNNSIPKESGLLQIIINYFR